MENRHGRSIDTGWILTCAGLVNGVAMTLNAYMQPGDGVIVMSPEYHAFSRVIRASGRDLVELPLAQEDGHYRMDWDAQETRLTGTEETLILYSPHNPGGRVWTSEELRQATDFCIRNDLIPVSDELDCDLVMSGHKPSFTATLCPHIADRLVTLTAAAKTFNIAASRSHGGNRG